MKMKYPSTPHLPFSETITREDRIIPSLDIFRDKRVIITEKRDGENTTMTKEYIHARSLDSIDHESRHFVKSIWSNIKHNIPNNWRICGENLYAKHSIFYDNLVSYFEVFNIWQNKTCLSWDDTVLFCELLELSHVPVLYDGIFTETCLPKINTEKQEGYVIRIASEFNYDNLHENMAKFVRKNHVQTNDHWLYTKIIPNKLKPC